MLEPVNEMGVIVVFSQYCESVGWEILSIQAGCPDAIIRHKDSQEVYRIEFEFCSSSFIDHGHDPNVCDAIVCWRDDLPTYFSFPVISISEWNGEKPEKISEMQKEMLALRIENRNLQRKVQELTLEQKTAYGNAPGKSDNITTRDRVFEYLRIKPGAKHSEIAKHLGISRQQVSKYINANGYAK